MIAEMTAAPAAEIALSLVSTCLTGESAIATRASLFPNRALTTSKMPLGENPSCVSWTCEESSDATASPRNRNGSDGGTIAAFIRFQPRYLGLPQFTCTHPATGFINIVTSVSHHTLRN